MAILAGIAESFGQFLEDLELQQLRKWLFCGYATIKFSFFFSFLIYFFISNGDFANQIVPQRTYD